MLCGGFTAPEYSVVEYIDRAVGLYYIVVGILGCRYRGLSEYMVVGM